MKNPLSIQQLHNDLSNKVYSCVQLVDQYLENINKHNDDLNAFLTISEDYAYAQAKRCDSIIADNPKAFSEFPLLGVVISLKDIYLTKGIRTTAASKVLENFTPQYSATVIKRLEDAGAIIIGKTNCDAWAHGGSGENSDFGPSKNPWNTKYVPGGSSSGSAVSVASNMSLVSMGTDTGGSVRLPASFCNLVGFKPTYGVVPRYGVISMASSLDSMGHFTHTVEDAERIFEVTKGSDSKDSTVVDHKNEKQDKLDSKKIKIGLPKEYFVSGLNDSVLHTIQRAVEVYKHLGVEFVEMSLPHTKYAISVYYIIQPAEVASNLARFDGVRYGAARELFGSEAKRRIMLGTYVLSAGYYDAYYLKAMKVRTKICQDFENAFEGIDAILAPVSPTPAFKLGEKTADPLKMYLTDIFTVAANLAGVPALAIPAGFGDDNLPIGFQLIGPRFSEQKLFELGKMYQSKTDWHTRQALEGKSHE